MTRYLISNNLQNPSKYETIEPNPHSNQMLPSTKTVNNGQNDGNTISNISASYLLYNSTGGYSKKAEMNMLFILHLQYHKHSVQNAGSSRERGYLEKR